MVRGFENSRGPRFKRNLILIMFDPLKTENLWTLCVGKSGKSKKSLCIKVSFLFVNRIIVEERE
jgi:hypothetical protein